MDAGFRQRLVGAAVVIALAVIFLPLFFDFRDDRAPGALDRSQPEPPDAAAAGYEDLPVDPRTSATPLAPPAEPLPEPQAEPAPPVEPAPVMTEPDTPEPPPPALALPDAAPAVPAPVPVPVEPAPTGAGRFSVVYGSFRNRANADEVKAQLALNVGIETRIEPISVDGRQLFRVRSDGHASRGDAEAERLRALAQIANLTATVSGNALPSADAPQRPSTEANPAAHAVQLGVFSTAAAAQQLADQLRRGGFNAYVEGIRLAAGQRYRVRVGPYTRRADAERIRDQLRGRHREAQVVAHP